MNKWIKVVVSRKCKSSELTQNEFFDTQPYLTIKKRYIIALFVENDILFRAGNVLALKHS